MLARGPLWNVRDDVGLGGFRGGEGVEETLLYLLVVPDRAVTVERGVESVVSDGSAADERTARLGEAAVPARGGVLGEQGEIVASYATSLTLKRRDVPVARLKIVHVFDNQLGSSFVSVVDAFLYCHGGRSARSPGEDVPCEPVNGFGLDVVRADLPDQGSDPFSLGLVVDTFVRHPRILAR